MNFRSLFPRSVGVFLNKFIKILLLFLALNVFFLSISLLGAFKHIGQGYGQKLIIQLASNPAVGLFIGILVTSIMQSSSATTSVVVALIAGGVFGSEPASSIKMAIPIIMGANIGTTITNTVVSLGNLASRKEFRRAFSSATVHDFFNILAVLVFFPLQLATNFLGIVSYELAKLFEDVGGIKFVSPLKLLIKPQKKLITHLFHSHPLLIDFVMYLIFWFAVVFFFIYMVRRAVRNQPVGKTAIAGAFVMAGITVVFGSRPPYIFCIETAEFVTGLGLLLGSLFVIVSVMRSMVLEKFALLLDQYVFKTDFYALMSALILTSIVQSSSVTTSIVVPLAGAGILTINQIYPYTLGANLGTTITAILAALSTKSLPAISVAFSHLLFNICGICVWYPLRRVPIFLAEKLGGRISNSPIYAIGFVVFVFFLLPITLIILL